MIQPTDDSKREQRHWYALYTRPRFEKKVDGILQQLEIPSFLPLRSMIRYWSNNRKRKITEPLFPSYVFVHANIRERNQAACVYGVARLVRSGTEPARIPEHQIQAVHRVLEHDCDPELRGFFQTGDAVQVISGPLSGLTGRFVQERGRNKFAISIDVIRQSIVVEISPAQLRRSETAEIRGSKDVGQTASYNFCN
ncbi:UpxY family transcription antiterminator [bacterium]|nr:UpxY family transcription antiterminator [bacterium]